MFFKIAKVVTICLILVTMLSGCVHRHDARYNSRPYNRPPVYRQQQPVYRVPVRPRHEYGHKDYNQYRRSAPTQQQQHRNRPPVNKHHSQSRNIQNRNQNQYKQRFNQQQQKNHSNYSRQNQSGNRQGERSGRDQRDRHNQSNQQRR